jgi:DNA (cytosine-5)-methyltransferase 1
MWPRADDFQRLAEFLRHEPSPLSERATAGFLSRASVSGLNFPPMFLEAVAEHLAAAA